jgi:hypothetical protein
MTTNILNEYLVSVHKQPVAQIQNLLLMSNKQPNNKTKKERTIQSDVILINICQLIALNFYFISVHKMSTWIKLLLTDHTTN